MILDHSIKRSILKFDIRIAVSGYTCSPKHPTKILTPSEKNSRWTWSLQVSSLGVEVTRFLSNSGIQEHSTDTCITLLAYVCHQHSYTDSFFHLASSFLVVHWQRGSHVTRCMSCIVTVLREEKHNTALHERLITY